MASVLDKLVDNQGSSYKSNSWYRNNVKKIYDKATARKLMNQGKLIGRPSVGRLNLFFYDPKTKDRLPYYDRFPLVLPLETIKGGFMGLNFHYLPPVLRLKLLEEMSQWSVKNDLSKNNRFELIDIDVEGSEYQILKNLNFNKYSFKLILVETHIGYLHFKQQSDKIHNLLKSKNYNYLKKFGETTVYENVEG